MKKLAIAVIGSLLLSGCESFVKKNGSNASSQENKLEQTQFVETDLGMQLLKQFEEAGIKSKELTQQEEKNELVKWIQPENKKEACKIFVGSYSGEDRTLDPTYKLYWDGKCKDGYAFGLGREFEKFGVNNLEALGEYSGGQVEPKYYMNIEKKDGSIQQAIGDLSNKKVKSSLLEKDSDELKTRILNAAGGYLFEDKIEKNGHELMKSIATHKNMSAMGINFVIFNKNPKRLTHAIALFQDKKGYVSLYYEHDKPHHFFKEGTGMSQYEKDVEISTNYLSATQSIQDEIKQKIKEVDIAVNYAEQKKQEYKNSICKDDVKVKFIDESEYKEICTKYEYFNVRFAAKEKKLEEQKIAEQIAVEHSNKIEQLANNETQLDANIYWHVSQINEKKLQLTKVSQGSASYTELTNELAYLSKELAPLEEAKTLIKLRQDDTSGRRLASERAYQDQVLRQQREAQQMQRQQFEDQQANQQMQQIIQGMSQFNQSMQQLNTPKYTNCYKTYSGANCIQY